MVDYWRLATMKNWPDLGRGGGWLAGKHFLLPATN